MPNVDFLLENLPILLPLILLELALMIVTVRHILLHRNYRFGNRGIWLFVVIIFQIIGPVVYFVFGRGDE